MEQIDKQVKKQFGSWVKFEKSSNQPEGNLKRKMSRNIDRLNKWLEPLRMEIRISKKR